MIEEGGDISAFESFTIDDAGGQKEAPKEGSKQSGTEASEPPSNDSATAPAPKQESAPAPQSQEPESTGERLQTSLEREPSVSPAAKRLALEKGVPIGHQIRH